ncbi:hypothetical protein WJX81_004995 [Elliptochloris bilobata]|uniref:Stomatal closure-related actin-binding protein PH domain-containing protein n=1 Tax=Elliptochloris bilobata TaxID=381761 RepID=A0AAW1SK02_9CHLO
MRSAHKRSRKEACGAMSLSVDSRQPIASVRAVAKHINKGGVCQPTASPIKVAAGVLDTRSDLLAHMLTCAQELWGRCAGRNKEDAATLVEGLKSMQQQVDNDANLRAVLESTQSRIQQLEVQLRAMQTRSALETQVPMEVTPQRASAFCITGKPAVGETVAVVGPDGAPPGTTQWLSGKSQEGPWLCIVGAQRSTYSPDPDDCGKWLACRVRTDALEVLVVAPATVGGVPEDWYEEFQEMSEKPFHAFKVVVVEHNGQPAARRGVCDLVVDTRSISLCKRGTFKPLYSSVVCGQEYKCSMQVCGARGGGDAAKQGVFLVIRKDSVWMLACKSPKERNQCIMLIRTFAEARYETLTGPT